MAGKNLFITTSSSETASNLNYRNTNRKTSSSTASLVTLDNNSLIDYGIISEYNLEIEQVRVDLKNEFVYVLMKYGVNVSSNQNLIALNCTIFKVNLSTNEMNCVESGLVLTNTYTNIINGVNDYHLDYFQFGSEKTFVFRTQYSDDFSAKSDYLVASPVFLVTTLKLEWLKRISPYSYEGERFLHLGMEILFGLEWKRRELWSERFIRLRNTLNWLEGNTIELSSSPNNVFAGDFQEEISKLLLGSMSQNKIVLQDILMEK